MQLGRMVSVLSFGLFFGQVAGATVYECTIEQLGGNLGWVPPTIAVMHDEAAGVVKINDGIILAVAGGPIDGKVETENTKRTTFTWNIQSKDDIQQGVRMFYRLTIMKADLSARIKALPGGYGNNFDAGGSCRRVAS